MKNAFYQKGYGGIEAFLIAVVIGIVIYFNFYPSFSPPSDSLVDSSACYIQNPDPADTIEFNGRKYVPLRLHTAIITVEIKTHLTSVGTVKDPSGEDRPAYTAWLDAIHEDVKKGVYPATDGVEDLLFLENDNSTYIPPAHEIMDIYRRTDKPVPSFILSFCKDYPKMESLILMQDVSKNSFPPRSFNTNDLQNWRPSTEKPCPPDVCYPEKNKKYVLVSYEPFRGRINLKVPGSWPSANLPITVDSQTVDFTVNYAYTTPIKLIALFDDRDRKQPWQYNYLPEELAIPVPVEPPNLDINFGPNWDNKTEQLRAFVPIQVPPWGWWTPECKPAVYLYPEKETLVNVQVQIKNGFLTYTDPLYPKAGWNVLASPNGSLRYLNTTFADSRNTVTYPTGIFPYLYYEGKVADTVVVKPEKGYVKKPEELSSFFDELLPRLGLNQKESKEFKEYWLKALPKASYYFIGIVPQEQLDQNEPLTIAPKEDTMIRVRLYFEALDAPRSVQAPEITTPKRTGFTVVDWGGMVKRDKNHPFTCLQ